MTIKITRRLFTLAGTSSFLSACNLATDQLSTGMIEARDLRPAIGVDANLGSSATMYGAQQDGEYNLPAIPYQKMDGRFRRQRVVNKSGMPKGSILIDPKAHHAYYMITNDEAVRYGVGVGKAGFEWSGDAVIGRKADWPRWTPPKEMIERVPKLAKFAGGMPGGPENPLGARALYLYANGRDTLYRLHGTPEWNSIGKSMSSGCIRFLNQDIIDLFNRVPVGTRVRVL